VERDQLCCQQSAEKRSGPPVSGKRLANEKSPNQYLAGKGLASPFLEKHRLKFNKKEVF